jgi:AcrR family transcriptional regulator
MADPSPARLSGRRAQAATNDGVILEAARAVFTADPSAPISAVAQHAGVGISALYRRYPSKEDLLRTLAADGLQRFTDELETALSDDRDPWTPTRARSPGRSRERSLPRRRCGPAVSGRPSC